MPRADDRPVLNGIFWVLRSGAPWRDLPERYAPHTTCYNRFRRRPKAGVWDCIMDAVSSAHEGNIRMIDGTSTSGLMVFGEVIGVHIDQTLLADGVYHTAQAEPILRGGGTGDYFAITEAARFTMKRP